MTVHFGTDSLRAHWGRSTVCIGTFDGVHLGHRQVVATAVRDARLHDEPCVLLTFDRHPAAVLAPDKVPPALATLSQNLDVFRELGVDVAVVYPFDRKTAETEADAFLDEVLVKRLLAERIVVGHDFALGHDRKGTAAWLAERIATDIVPPYEVEGLRVSSSAVRSLVLEGKVAEAAGLLGRPLTLQGVVVSGQKLGRRLGFPTINLSLPVAQAVPGDGVYAGTCRIGSARFAAAIGIGTRPTVGGQERSIEAYLIDYPGDSVYGRSVDLAVVQRIREEIKFDSMESLAAQMEDDVRKTRGLVSA
ncbi:MAG: bifunctional riboflavin kinase/FAD synthetase [Armatimonadetes bacterium]|nr:bifunctional riboflavin kinase/FAD synthetase [Armatimonadota bacterium]